MNTISAPTMGSDHPFTKERWKRIEDIIAAGKVARFWYHNRRYYKDVNSTELEMADEEHGDLKAFHQSGGVTHYVCWDSPDLELEEVEP